MIRVILSESCKSLTDNKSLLDSVHSTKTLKEKRLLVDICIIRDMLQKKEISSVNWCTSKAQLRDCLTKPTASPSRLISVLHRECDIIKNL